MTERPDMKYEIREKKKNAVMKRTEARVSIEHSGAATPNRLQLLDEVAKLLKTKPENLIIDRIITPGGSTVSEASVLVYSKKGDIPAWRLKKMEQRLAKAREKGQKPGEKPAEKPGAVGEAPKTSEDKPDDKESPKPPKDKPEDKESPKPDEVKPDENPPRGIRKGREAG